MVIFLFESQVLCHLPSKSCLCHPAPPRGDRRTHHLLFRGLSFGNTQKLTGLGKKINTSAILPVVMSVWEMNKAGLQGRPRVFKPFSAGSPTRQFRCLPSITSSETPLVPASYGHCLCSSPSAVILCLFRAPETLRHQICQLLG